jgi:hypothetical protein
MGIIRKALFIMTGGLSGLVFKDSSSKGRKAAPAAKRARAQKQPQAAQAKAKPARRKRTQPAKAKATAARNGTADEIERVAKLHGDGVLSSEEFAAAKAKILGTSAIPSTAAEPGRAPSTYPPAGVARDLAHLADGERAPSIERAPTVAGFRNN